MSSIPYTKAIVNVHFSLTTRRGFACPSQKHMDTSGLEISTDLNTLSSSPPQVRTQYPTEQIFTWGTPGKVHLCFP